MTAEAKPHYHGHRDRLRQRFRENPSSLADYELLELVLFLAIPQRDVKPLAKNLITRFGGLSGVLNASADVGIITRSLAHRTRSWTPPRLGAVSSTKY